ncbi:hypothetical protein LCGC14_0535510 [marine sediment metagenome]|uniref:Uncharacterized protein n=1 Tax=marine sediment metagenome TaxID=412755 RepID=A0A0F9SCQ6_9ZZZZ
MNITVSSTKVLSKGTNKHGDWKLVKVLTQDTEYTTFADGAENLAPGTVINITDMDEDAKGKKFKKYDVINGSQPTPESPEKPIERTKDRDAMIMEAMWFKELGNRIGDNSLERDWPKTHERIANDYYREMAKHTGVKFAE